MVSSSPQHKSYSYGYSWTDTVNPPRYKAATSRFLTYIKKNV